MIRSLPVSVSLATVAVVAAACAVPDTAKTGLRLGDEANGAIVWTAGGREIAATDRIIYADPIQREEYALFEKDGIRAEIVYITTRDLYNKNVALEHWLSFDDMITGFNHVKKGRVELGDAFRADTGWIKLWAKPFRLANAEGECAGFSTEWDRPSDDPDMRPGKALMGYFCRPADNTLTTAAIEGTLSGLGIRGINVKKRESSTSVADLPDSPSQTALAMRANGSGADADKGNPDFPFAMGVIYPTGDNCISVSDC